MVEPGMLWGFINVIVGVIIVVILAYITLKLSRNYMNRLSKGKNIRIIEMVSLYNKSAIGIVKIGNDYIAVGITEHQINVIKKLDEKEIINNNINEIKSVQLNEYLKNFKSRFK